MMHLTKDSCFLQSLQGSNQLVVMLIKLQRLSNQVHHRLHNIIFTGDWLQLCSKKNLCRLLSHV